jgi:hypothetical protein
MTDRQILTFQTRLNASVENAAALDAYATLFGKVERSLLAAQRSGQAQNDIKREFLVWFGITAREFNATRISPPIGPTHATNFTFPKMSLGSRK